jgi:hypothetical protein
MELEPAAERDNATPVVPRRRWFHRESISLAEVAVQTFAVVLGILLALAIGEWSKDREERQQVTAAVRALRAEVESNRAEIANALKHIAQSDAEMADKAKSATSSEPRPCTETPGWHGLAYPLLLDTAYQTAIGTQILAHMDFDRAQIVAHVYGEQHVFQKYLDHAVDFTATGKPMTVESCRYVIAREEKAMLDKLDAAYTTFLDKTKSPAL